MSPAAGTPPTITAFTLRPLGRQDEDFSFRVYASTRTDEMKLVDWTDERKDAFLRLQFNAQSQHYHLHYPRALWQVIETQGGAIGRLITDDSDPQILLVMDIVLLPEFRGRGTGTAILRRLLQTANRANKTVSLHVEPINPALNLYQRLGFVICGQSGFYLEMQRPPDPGAVL